MTTPSLTWRAWTSRATVGFALMFLILAAILLPLAWVRMTDATLLARDGIDTRGVVTDREITSHSRSTGVTTHSYYLTLRFTDAQNQTRTARHPVSQRIFNRMPAGSALSLRYSASDPTVSEIKAGDTRAQSLLFGALGALSAGVAAIFVWVLARSLRAQRRAAQIGERRMATVTRLVRSGKRRSKYYVVHWQAGDLSGRSTAQHVTRLPAVGDTIPVYIDPHSGRGWWEGEY